MKRLSNHIAISLLLACNCTVFAQDPDKTTSEKPVINEALAQRLSDDLSSKIPETKNIKLGWELTAFGYKAIYTFSNLDYMTWYDKDGDYVETLLKTPWDDRVPIIVKMELDNSAYSKCTVMTFWARINADNTDYNLQLVDADGKSYDVWTDENGHFSKIPVFAR